MHSIRHPPIFYFIVNMTIVANTTTTTSTATTTSTSSAAFSVLPANHKRKKLSSGIFMLGSRTYVGHCEIGLDIAWSA